MLEIKNISKTFRDKVLDDVTFNVSSRSNVAVLGPSGSGKSTLLNCITGFETPDCGQVIVNGLDITSLSSNKRPLGMVFQNFSLFPNMTAYENIAYPLRVKGKNTSAVSNILNVIGMEEHADKYPKQLSGGQQQRVAIARALVYNPDVILMDEPLASLDLKLRIKLQKDIKQLLKDTTVVYVTHDFTEAFNMCDTIVIMNQGKVEQVGSPTEILDNPRSDFVNEFVCETWKDYTASVFSSSVFSPSTR